VNSVDTNCKHVELIFNRAGPIFYRWKVAGLNKRHFTGYKFRTMVINADEIKEKLMDKNEIRGHAFKMRDDPRVTKVGRFLRKYSLDPDEVDRHTSRDK